MMEQGAAPARGRPTLLPLPGGAGAPPGPTTGACQELADGGPLRLSGPWAKRGAALEDVAMARRKAQHLRLEGVH
jgi:hypothetical protein